MSIEPIVIDKNGYKIVDPNPPGSVVNHEDLFTFVKLEAKTTGKTFITRQEDKPYSITENLNFSSIDLTTGSKKPFLTTNWTEIGGSQFKDDTTGKDLEGFGITNIDIKIQGSYIPQVTIDFVDIRGATLFEQGSCSPYGVFFHLPYPVFELTVKGYYGKPVKYFLNLTKFNTKFNAETGNFECRGEFIGWSYAFLADMLMGFVAATPYMKEFDTKSKLKNIYETVFANYKKNDLISGVGEDNPYIIGEEPITIVDFLKKIKDLEILFGKIKNTNEFNELEELTKLRKNYINLNKLTNELITDLTKYSFKNEKTLASPPESKNRLVINNIAIQKEVNENIVNKINFINNQLGVIKGIQPSISNLELSNTDNIISKLDPIWTNIPINLTASAQTQTTSSGSNAYIDLGYITQKVSKDIKLIDDELKSKRNTFKDIVNSGVIDILQIKPTVRNILTILTCNTEVFISALLECAEKAEKYHEDNSTSGSFVENRLNNKSDNTSPKIYPWPTYYVSEDSKTVEKFPGDNVDYLAWFEVRFVEDFLKALTRLNQEFKEISVDEKTGIPGFDFFFPIITPLESKYFDGNSEISYTQLDTDQTGNDFEKIFKDRLFTLFHHTLMDPVFSNNINVGLGYNPTIGKDTWLKNKYPQIRSNDIIPKIAAVDAINLLNTIKSQNVLESVKRSVDNLKISGEKKLSEINKTFGNLLDKTGIEDSQYYVYNKSEIEFKNKVIIKPNWYEMDQNYLFQILDVTPPTGYELDRYDDVKLGGSVTELLGKLNNERPLFNKDPYFNLDEGSNSLLLYDDKFKLFHDLTLTGEKDAIKKTLGTISKKGLKFDLPTPIAGVEQIVPNEGETNPNDCLPTMELPNVGIFKAYKAYSYSGSFIPSNTHTPDQTSATEITEIPEITSEKDFEKWSDAVVFDTLTMSPLWLDNVNRFRKDKLIKPNSYTDEKIQSLNLAYLFLSSCRPNPLIINLNDGNTSYDLKNCKSLSIEPFYKMGGVVKSPKLWVLGMGATLWRWKMFMGELTDSERNIRPGFTWKHPLFGDSPTGRDPLAQPHGVLKDSKEARYNGSEVLTKQFPSINVGSIIQATTFNTIPKFDNSGVPQKNRVRSGNSTEKITLGYAFDYWGVYMNDKVLNESEKRFINHFGGELYTTWPKYLEFIKKTKQKNPNNSWIADGDLDFLAGDDKEFVTNYYFSSLADAYKYTSYPGVYITPWQHFYYRAVFEDNKQSPKNHTIIMRTGNDKFNNDYTSSFIGSNWFYQPNLENDKTILDTKILNIETKQLDIEYKFIYYNNSSSNVEGRYGDLIALLPDFVKNQFVEKFETWCDTNFNNLLKKIDPVNFSDSKINLLAESYVLDIIGNDKFGDYIYEETTFENYPLKKQLVDDTYVSALTFNEAVAEAIYAELFDSYYYIINSTPKLWNCVYSNLDSFVANKDLADKYIKEFKKVFNDNYKTVLDNLQKEEIQDESAFGESVLDDGDIKLSLYRTFKSITDKWISSSTEEKKFFNVVGEQGGDTRTLSEHFSFVTRTMKDIGDEAVIDPTIMLQVTDNPKMSLYNLIVDVLKENNFDFFPLPTFSNFTNNNEGELKEMFKPVTDFTPVKGGPNFICMYVGGTSRGLDIQPPANNNCPIDNSKLTNPNDGFDISGENLPQEYTDDKFKDPIDNNNRIENAGFTAFKVAYGAENQNHFRSVQLDQSEFTETNESLLIIDKLSQGGDPSNRSLKGNNLHNVYLTRSYSCTVESLGNMQIQPLQYFELTNIPMFRGTYLITEVSHNIKPHFVGTSFKGVRQPLTTVPIVTDILSIMNLSFNDAEASSGDRLSLNNIINKKVGSGGSGGLLLSGIKETTITLPSGVAQSIKKLDPLLDVVYNNNENFKTDKGNPEWIVLHWSGGFDFNSEIAALKKNRLAYHLTIDTDGSINQLYDLNKKASHAGCQGKQIACKEMNSLSIGISYVGGAELDGKTPYYRTWAEWQTEDLNYEQLGKCKSEGCRKTTYKSKKQWESIINSILIAKAQHPTIKGITSHHLTSADKSDVGDNFPWTELFTAIEKKSGWKPVFGNQFRDSDGDNAGQLIKEFQNQKFIDFAQDLVEYQQSSGFGNENFTIKEIYDYLNNKIKNQNLVFGIMGNIEKESQFQNYATGDGPKQNGVGLPSQNGKWYCSWGFTQLNVCGGEGKTFLKEQNLENADNADKIRALSDPKKHLDYVINWVQKNYSGKQDTVENWAKRFAADYERCSGCNIKDGKEQLDRASKAINLSKQTWG